MAALMTCVNGALTEPALTESPLYNARMVREGNPPNQSGTKHTAVLPTSGAAMQPWISLPS